MWLAPLDGTRRAAVGLRGGWRDVREPEAWQVHAHRTLPCVEWHECVEAVEGPWYFSLGACGHMHGHRGGAGGML